MKTEELHVRANTSKAPHLTMLAVFFLAQAALSAASVILDDFEGELVKYPADKKGWEANDGAFSKGSISQSTEAKNGSGAAEILLKVKPGGWALVQKKVEGADWLTQNPKAISFWVKGNGSGKMIVELEESYSFKWRKEVSLGDTNWHQVTLNFSEFICDAKPAMSVPDLVVVKFLSLDGTQKFLVDDIQIELDEPEGGQPEGEQTGAN